MLYAMGLPQIYFSPFLIFKVDGWVSWAEVEILLFSLGACQEITTKAFANAMGVPLTRVSVELTGHIDLRGFFAVDDSVRAGFNKRLGRPWVGCSLRYFALSDNFIILHILPMCCRVAINVWEYLRNSLNLGWVYYSSWFFLNGDLRSN